MKTLKQYKYVLAAVVVLAALAAVRAFNPGIFRYDAVRWAEPSVRGENMISRDKLPTIGGEVLFVMLDTDCQVPDLPGTTILTADPQDLVSGDYSGKIRRNKGPVVLCSEDLSISARVWMVLSETGIRNLYILRKDPA
ncbi:MAG: hypothetical protein P1P83_07905 [Bacteroidales bacterium]|nr:hypothetical protein [Bacteroidales bacterium]MDT8373550.1 hypothetical protein [Bacteroidales bacterium]